MRAAALAGLACVALTAACTGTARPHARAQRVGALEETIGGPHAIGRVGDFLLENDQIRLIVADKGPGRVNLPFGGSLVDADLVRPGGPTQGNDQLAELLPGFLFVGLDPTDVEVTEDGSQEADGGVAEVTVTGSGNDLLQMIGLLDAGLVFPSDLELKQAYRLHPGQRYVEIVTTVTNKSTGAHPFPFLNPTQLAATGLGNIPSISSLQLSVPMGQLPLLGGEQDLFAPGVAGFNVHFAITDSYALAKGFPAFPGMVVDFLASRGKGVSYGVTIPASPTNYVNTYGSLYSQGQTVTPFSMVIPFTYAGVSAVYMNEPPPILESGEQYSFTSYFVVGKGDVGSVLDTIYEIRGTATGTFGGQVIDARTSAPLAAANVLILDAGGNPIDQLETDAGGAFLGHLAPGSYSYQVLADDHLTTSPVGFTVTADQATGVLVQIAPPGTIAVSVIDETGRHAPCKVMLVGHFDAAHAGADPRTFLYSFKLGERQRTTPFDGSTAFVENAWWTKDGHLEATVRPGSYDLIVSRGPEYELHTEPVVIPAGGFAESEIQLVRSYATPGWVAGDFHLHAAPSTDSGLPLDQRVISAAAEGLDVAVATDHNFVTDYTQTIAEQGLDTWLLGITGLELTTFEMGHFIGFPLKVDPGSTRGGEFVWAGQVPQKLFDQLHNDLALEPGNSIVDIAHPRQQVLGYFAQFFVDAANAAPYTPTGILGVFAPYGDEFKPENFSYDFDALEVITNNHYEDIHSFVAPDPLPSGTFPDPQPVPGQVVVGTDGRPEFPGVVETWFAMLDRGLRPTAMGASDSHHLLGDEPGYARTLVFVGAGKDVPGGFSRSDVVDAVKAHRCVATNAPMIEMTIAGHMVGDTVVAKGQVPVAIHVRAPSWAQVDHVLVYQGNGGAVVADLAVPAGQGTDYTTTVTLAVTADTWVVTEATGTQNMFPVNSAVELPPLDASVIIQALSIGLDLSSLPIASNLKPQRQHTAHPYALTNPIWIDADGDGWTPPQQPLSRKVMPRRAAAPDVRQAFARLPDVSP